MLNTVPCLLFHTILTIMLYLTSNFIGYPLQYKAEVLYLHIYLIAISFHYSLEQTYFTSHFEAVLLPVHYNVKMLYLSFCICACTFQS